MVDDGPEVLHVAEMFGAVARVLAASRSVQETLQMIVDLAVEHLDSCEYAGVSFVEGREITSPASSHDVPRILDAIQSEVGEGPCIDAIREHAVFETGELTTETRWPRFSTRAHEETGVSSVLSIRLFVEEDTMGALNMYSTKPHAFTDMDAALATVFASHAAAAVLSARREEQLEHKAETRDLIGQAKGILMARSEVGEDEAFEMLRRASQRLNVKVVDVADRVVHHDADAAPSP